MSNTARKIRMILDLRRYGIRDRRVLEAMERIPRESFIPEQFHDKAYTDMTLPIGRGQTISQPTVVAAMTEALELNDRHKVLEVGTGSGYQAAILSRIARRVYSIERHKPLLQEAEQRLLNLHITNVVTLHGDGTKGWPNQAPFARIMVTAAAFEAPPPDLIDQLEDDGIMVIPMARQIYVYKKSSGGLTRRPLMPADFVPLVDGLEEDAAAPVPHPQNRTNIVEDLQRFLRDGGGRLTRQKSCA